MLKFDKTLKILYTHRIHFSSAPLESNI